MRFTPTPFLAHHEERVRNRASHMTMLGLSQFAPKANGCEKRVKVNGEEYRSAAEAHRATGIPEKSIREACNGVKRNGWKFKAKFV